MTLVRSSGRVATSGSAAVRPFLDSEVMVLIVWARGDVGNPPSLHPGCCRGSYTWDTRVWENLCREDPGAAQQVDTMMLDMKSLLDDYKLLRTVRRGPLFAPILSTCRTLASVPPFTTAQSVTRASHSALLGLMLCTDYFHGRAPARGLATKLFGDLWT